MVCITRNQIFARNDPFSHLWSHLDFPNSRFARIVYIQSLNSTSAQMLHGKINDKAAIFFIVQISVVIYSMLSTYVVILEPIALTMPKIRP